MHPKFVILEAEPTQGKEAHSPAPNFDHRGARLPSRSLGESFFERREQHGFEATAKLGCSHVSPKAAGTMERLNRTLCYNRETNLDAAYSVYQEKLNVF